MMRGARRVVALSLLVACGGENSVGRISRVSVTATLASRSDGADRKFFEVEFTMPKRFPVELAGTITMTDTSGRLFRATETSLSSGSDQGQRIHCKFEVEAGSELGVLHVGNYDVDVSSGRVTDSAAP